MNIIIPSTEMRKSPNIFSELETECLFGESVKIIDSFSNWFYCKLITDNSYGWLQKSDLGFLKNSTHRVISNRTFLYKEANIKSSCINYVPLGGQLAVTKTINNWAEIDLIVNNKVAYTPIKSITKLDSKITDWVSIAEKLIGTPYKWGGRNSLGIDCSALLQISYQAYGENICRNTNDQVNLKKEIIHNINDLKRGCVIFWQGHVGIMVDNFNCIHSNAFHMETIIEPLENIILRNKKKYPIIKMMNFN